MSNSDHVALVTGAASGIGAATAALLVEHGWTVVGVDRHAGREEDYQLDVTDREGLVAATDEVVARHGRIDLLVTSAGYDERCDFTELSLQRWDRMIDVLLGGTVNACAAVLPHMTAARRGTIVTIASELALIGCAGHSHYAAAKGAVVAFTKSLSLEMASSAIRVNCVAPGPTDTPLLPPNSEWRDEEYVRALPLRRLVYAQEVAGAVLFLAESGSYFSGEVLSPNAGAVI